MPIAARSPFAAARLVTATRPGPVCPCPPSPPAGASRRVPPFVLGGAEGGPRRSEPMPAPFRLPGPSIRLPPVAIRGRPLPASRPVGNPASIRAGRAAPPLPGTSIDFPDQAPPGPRAGPCLFPAIQTSTWTIPRPRCPSPCAGTSGRRSSLSPQIAPGTITHSPLSRSNGPLSADGRRGSRTVRRKEQNSSPASAVAAREVPSRPDLPAHRGDAKEIVPVFGRIVSFGEFRSSADGMS